MSRLVAHAGDFVFQGRFEEQLAPKTCAAFRKAMPFESQAGTGAAAALGNNPPIAHKEP
jgi:hypothetical protein